MSGTLTEEQKIDLLLSFAVEMRDQLNRVEKKIDKILELVVNMCGDIAKIKSESRSEDEKIILITKKIDQILEQVSTADRDSLSAYQSIVERKIENWNALDGLTKEFLTIAEFLYSKLQNIPNADFSASVLQFCRSLENEMLRKLFIDYTRCVISEKDIVSFLESDLGNEKTHIFAKHIKKARDGAEPKYTIGEMTRILSYLSGSTSISASPLLAHFSDYLKVRAKRPEFFSKENLKEMDFINSSYRNKCAHVEKLSVDDGSQCKDIIPKKINMFVESMG